MVVSPIRFLSVSFGFKSLISQALPRLRERFTFATSWTFLRWSHAARGSSKLLSRAAFSLPGSRRPPARRRTVPAASVNSTLAAPLWSGFVRFRSAGTCRSINHLPVRKSNANARDEAVKNALVCWASRASRACFLARDDHKQSSKIGSGCLQMGKERGGSGSQDDLKACMSY